MKGIQSQELSASAAEFIPRPIRDRKMPTKYEDYEVKSVRTMRAKRLRSGGTSPPTGKRKERVIWNSNSNPSDSSESEQESALCRIPRVRTLRRQQSDVVAGSATATTGQSEAESINGQQQSVHEDAKRPTPRVRMLHRIRLEHYPSNDEQSTVVKRRTPTRIIWNSRFHSVKHEVQILYNDADNDSALASSHDFTD